MPVSLRLGMLRGYLGPSDFPLSLTVYHSPNCWREMARFLQGPVPEYRYRVKGLLFDQGDVRPVPLYAWT